MSKIIAFITVILCTTQAWASWYNEHRGRHECRLHPVSEDIPGLTFQLAGYTKEVRYPSPPPGWGPYHHSGKTFIWRPKCWQITIEQLETLIDQLTSQQKDSITILNLNGISLGRLPFNLTQLVHLKQLWLCDMGLTEIPESLAHLRGVEHLDLSENQITVVPEFLGRLTKLNYLSLEKNQIEIFPQFLSCLTALTYLKLSRNHIQQAPQRFGRLHRTIYLIDYEDLTYKL